VEGAGGLGHLLAQQLVAAGERVLDVPPKLAARVRLLQAGDTNKNDPNDALSVAVAALRSKARRQVLAEDHAAVLKVWSKRHRDLARSRNQVACRRRTAGRRRSRAPRPRMASQAAGAFPHRVRLAMAATGTGSQPAGRWPLWLAVPPDDPPEGYPRRGWVGPERPSAGSALPGR
jgi:transposase